MGKALLDRFSYLHFASGVVANFWSIPLGVWVVINVLYELLENSPVGLRLLSKVPAWPGGKPERDSLLNSVSDVVMVTLGWLSVGLLG